MCKDAWRDCSAGAARYRRRGDRIATFFAALHMSAFDPKRTLPSPLPLRCTTSLPNVGGTKLGHLRWELFRFFEVRNPWGFLRKPGHAKDRRYLFEA